MIKITKESIAMGMSAQTKIFNLHKKWFNDNLREQLLTSLTLLGYSFYGELELLAFCERYIEREIQQEVNIVYLKMREKRTRLFQYQTTTNFEGKKISATTTFSK